MKEVIIPTERVIEVVSLNSSNTNFYYAVKRIPANLCFVDILVARKDKGNWVWANYSNNETGSDFETLRTLITHELNLGHRVFEFTSIRELALWAETQIK